MAGGSRREQANLSAGRIQFEPANRAVKTESTPLEGWPQKIPLIFFRSGKGTEAMREWLRELPEAERRVGKDLLRAQGRWPVGMPLCRPMGNGLWEIRTDLPTKRTARVMLCVYREHLVALDGFIKKTRATQDSELALARKRQKELMR